MEEWQRRLVDPTHGGGKFGSYPGFAGPVGTGMLLGALPGLGYRQFWKGGKDLLSMSRQLSPQQLLRQMQRRLRRRDPSLTGRVRPNTSNMARDLEYKRMLRPQLGGRRGTRFPSQGGNQKFRQARTTLGDLEREYLNTIR